VYPGMNYSGMNSGHGQSPTEEEESNNGYSNWNGGPSGTLNYTQTVVPAAVADGRSHPGYCKHINKRKYMTIY
jgi:hypothetical protein